MTDRAQGLQVLDWDSGFFGRRIARLHPPVDPVTLDALLTEADASGIECCYLLCPAGNQALLTSATRSGFGLMDIRLLLERPLTGAAAPATALPPGFSLRPARAEDLPPLESLAATLHTNTRFFNDPCFDHSRSAELYARWLNRDFASPDTVFLVLESPAGAAGYATVTTKDPCADIGLVGIAPGHQGRGLGCALIRALLAAASARGCTRVRVVTQGSGVPAQRLYQKSGFITASVDLWLHRWHTPAP